MPVRIRIRYPRWERERALLVARLFDTPKLEVELIEDGVDTVVIEGPTFATSDPTRATVLVRRYLVSLEKRSR